MQTKEHNYHFVCISFYILVVNNKTWCGRNPNRGVRLMLHLWLVDVSIKQNRPRITTKSVETLILF